jgi:alpha-beta hydrolase superfamily lysophospholipase
VKKTSVALSIALGSSAMAQTEFSFSFAHPTLSHGATLQLEAYEYMPEKWNGHVIVMSHGSTGGKTFAIKASAKYLNISKFANANGYAFVTYMRKGRGKSEGEFTEETGKCDLTNLHQELAEAQAQLHQVAEQTMQRYKVSKLILMGHSRGGLLSSTYAGKHPEHISAVINLAGAWSAGCENRSGFGKSSLEQSAKNFRPQLWAYFENDSYFKNSKFNDYDYTWLSKTAQANQLVFKKYEDQGMPDGHSTPTYKPKDWAADFFPFLNEHLKTNAQ